MNTRTTHIFTLFFSSVAAVALFCLPAVGQTSSDDTGDGSRFTELRRTKGTVNVHARPLKNSPRLAKIFSGAILRVAPTAHRRGCKKGWMERENGGYVCSRYLTPTDETDARPARRDEPELLVGLNGWVVERGGSKMYRRPKHIDRHVVYKRLIKGSFLMAQEEIHRYGTDYVKTREGMWATVTNAKKLPRVSTRLGTEVAPGEKPLTAVAIEETPIYTSPDSSSQEKGGFARWQAVRGESLSEVEGSDGWYQLASGGFVQDSKIALVRDLPAPRGLESDEKWIVVDLKEQLLHAYVGEQLVMVIPCSTGIRNNTRPGSYRVQWKRRLQTMRLRGGHLRVEDVQWVMYYDRKRSIAIHAAYWHDDFGKPMSHGCVNLPTDDAKWLYNWALPFSHAEDSENQQSTPRIKGTRVSVFK